MSRRLAVAFFVFSLLALFVLCLAPRVIDHQINRVIGGDLPDISEAGRTLHAQLNVVDLHADPLLWDRDLNSRDSSGHVDVPRLIDGNVAVQVFSAPTQVPLGLNYEANELHWDLVTSLAIFQGWPVATWTSPLQRALYMAAHLRRMAGASHGHLRLIETRSELGNYLAERTQNPVLTAGLLSIEGMHAMEGKLENIEVLRKAGFRMMGLAHFFDNDLGGSAHGMVKGGLTDLGRRAVTEMQANGIIVDLAHASPNVIDEVVAISRRPVVVSHGGLKGTCDTIRNLSDERARAIASTGGVIAIGYWDAAICDVSVAGVVKAIQYGIATVGADAIALGSDFDGATETPFDTGGLGHITDGLLAAGVSEADIRKVMGENALRVLKTIPE